MGKISVAKLIPILDKSPILRYNIYTTIERDFFMKLTRFTALILLAASLLLLFAGCEKEEPEISTEPAIEVTEPIEAPKLILVEDGKTDFKIIRSEDAVGYDLDTSMLVYQRAKATLSSSFKITEDWNSPLDPTPADAHEILLFETNRAESAAALADLDVDGYLIRVTEHKIVIVGSSPSACNAALYYFFDTLIPEHTENGVIALPIGFEKKQAVERETVDIAQAMRDGKTVGADFKIVFEYSGPENFRTAQGAATDGKYAYVAMKDGSGGTEVDKIIKIDMATWEIVAESEILPLDHANDMTYDPEKKQLIVTNMYNCLISLIDPDTLTLIQQPTLPFGTWGIGYIDNASKYTFLASGNMGGVMITDSAFTPISNIPCGDTMGYTGQGMDADANLAYVPLSPNAGKKDNIIQIYDLTAGEYLGYVTVSTKMESESMFHTNGKQYMHFNAVGSKIAELEYYIRFE